MMARYWVRVSDDFRWDRVQCAGREFVKGERVSMHESEPGFREVAGCVLLEVEADEDTEGEEVSDAA